MWNNCRLTSFVVFNSDEVFLTLMTCIDYNTSKIALRLVRNFQNKRASSIDRKPLVYLSSFVIYLIQLCFSTLLLNRRFHFRPQSRFCQFSLRRFPGSFSLLFELVSWFTSHIYVYQVFQFFCLSQANSNSSLRLTVWCDSSCTTNFPRWKKKGNK